MRGAEREERRRWRVGDRGESQRKWRLSARRDLEDVGRRMGEA